MTDGKSELYGDGETVDASNPKADGEIQTIEWSDDAPPREELTETQQAVIEKAHNPEDFESLADLAAQMGANKSYTAQILRRFWPEAHTKIRDDSVTLPGESMSEGSDTTDTTDDLDASKTSDYDQPGCYDCDEYYRDKPDFMHYCPKCGRELTIMSPAVDRQEENNE
jgi:hypothetical protein